MITILEHEWLTQDAYLGIDCMTQIKMITQDLVNYSVNNWTRIYPPIYPPCSVCQSLLEVDKGWCTATRTRWRHRFDHTLHTLSHVQLKKAFEALSTIRTVSNDILDVHEVVVVWMVSSMKELLHLPNQLLPIAIHQSVSTCPRILLVKVESTVEVVYVTFSLDVTNYASEVR